jgi:hypothetical protein
MPTVPIIGSVVMVSCITTRMDEISDPADQFAVITYICLLRIPIIFTIAQAGGQPPSHFRRWRSVQIASNQRLASGHSSCEGIFFERDGGLRAGSPCLALPCLLLTSFPRFDLAHAAVVFIEFPTSLLGSSGSRLGPGFRVNLIGYRPNHRNKIWLICSSVERAL